MTSRLLARPASAAPALPLALLLLVVFLIYSSTYYLIALLPVHVRSLGESETGVGWIMGLFSGAALAIRPFAGVVADRIGRRPGIVLGGLLIGFGCIGYAIAGPGTIVLARLLNGAGWGAVTALTATIATDMAPPTRRGAILGIYGMTIGVAMATGPSIGLWLATFSPTHAFLAAAACGFGAAAGALLLRAPSPPRAAGRLRLAPGTLFSRSAAGPAAIMLCFTLTYGAVLSFVPLLTLDRGLGTAGPFFTMFAVALIFLRLAGGSLSDRLGRAAVIGPGFVSGAVALLLLGVGNAYPVLLVAAVLYAVAFAFIQPASQAWSVDRSPTDGRATALATVIAAQDIGITLGSLLGGVLADARGYTDVFVAAAFISLVGLAVVGMVHTHAARRPRQQAGENEQPGAG